MRNPTLIVNPADDDVFARYADSLLDDGVSSAEELALRLRRAYPRAVVHLRELTGELSVVWYVYREGHWVISHQVPGHRNSEEVDQAGPGTS